VAGGKTLAVHTGPADKAALYSPCLRQSLSALAELAGNKQVPCGEASLTVRRDGTTTVLVLKAAQSAGMAAKAPELVSSVLPNLPAPAMARSIEIRQVMKLDLRAQPDLPRRTRRALEIYREAEVAFEGYERMGGHRFARWLLDEGRLETENELLPEGPAIVLQFFPGEGPPGALTDAERGLYGPDAVWAGPWERPGEPGYLLELRKAMMAQGWWYDDAEAFMTAAAVDGVERTSAAGAALRVIGEWLRTSDQWDARTRHTIWADCFSPRMNATTGGVARERLDQLAGATNIEPFAEPPDYHNPEEQITVEGKTFNASIGSPAHAYCAVAMGDPLIDTPQETSANRVLRRAQAGPRAIAERLIKSPKFLAAIGEELQKARAQLLKPGAPEL